VISPFKYYYAKKEKGIPIKCNNNGVDSYIYEKEVDFADYYERYCNEREKYPIIFKNILSFETQFNAIVSYNIMVEYNIDSIEKFKYFIDCLYDDLDKLNVNKQRKQNMKKHINEIAKNVFKYSSVYITLDRLTLGQLLTVFVCLEGDIKHGIFVELNKRELTFKTVNINQFENVLFDVISIRNCISHKNSLEIKILFYNVKNNIMRSKRDKKRIKKLISLLSEHEKRE